MASLADKVHEKEDAGKIVDSTNVSGIIQAANEVALPQPPKRQPKAEDDLERELKDAKAQLKAYKQKEEEELKKKASKKKPGRKSVRKEEYQCLSIAVPLSMYEEIVSVATKARRTSITDYFRMLVAKDLKENRERYEQLNKENDLWE